MSAAVKVALVTGSGKHRVGAAVVDVLAKRGYRLVVHYRSSRSDAEESVARLRGNGVEALAIQADISDEHAVQGMFDQTLKHFGRLDVLVNCAAIWQRKRLEDVTAQDVRQHFETNTLGTFLCCRHAGLQMVMQPEGGSIVNLGDWAIERPYLDYAAYFPSKGAIPTLTRSFAVELGTRNPNVRVNCILPGPVMLPPTLSKEDRDHSIASTLVKREGTPQHIADAVLFLVENDFITGTCFPIDGGRTIFAPNS